MPEEYPMPLLPEERTDEHHVTKHAQLLSLPGRDSLEVVLLGDSLTRRWEDNPDQWNRYFGGLRAGNFGVGADSLENVLWRIRSGQLAGLRPRVVVVLAGTNNLPRDPVETIVQGLAQLTRELGEVLPGAKVLLLGLLPRNPDETGRDYGSMVVAVNRSLAPLADGKRVFFRDFGVLFPPKNGLVDPEMMPDGLHLGAAGYDRLGPTLVAAIREIQG
jgi:lysophospholipase L1-like esterase